ncbi:MAG: SpoIIE family protein phosphatase [Mariniphaga sp.]|nr:SpoIIE family protein phosphatase [Mariniphaga sp.]
MKNKNLSYRLSIYFLITETILSVIVILVGYNYLRHSVFESYRYRLQYDVQEVLGDVQNSMDEAVRFTENLTADFNQGLPLKNPKRYLEMAFKVQRNLLAFGMVTSAQNELSHRKPDFLLYKSGGIVKSDTGRFKSYIARTDEWIKEMLHAASPEWSAPFYNSQIGSRVITYARPLDFEQDGKMVHATFFCAVSLDHDLVKLKHQKMIKSGFSILLNEHDLIVYHPDSTKTGKDVSSIFNCFGGSQFEIRALLKDRVGGSQIIHPNCMKNKRTVAIYWPVKSTNWFIFNVIPESLFMSELKQITLAMILLILLIGSITAAIMIFLSIRFVSPISVLADDSRRIVEDAGFDPVPRLNDLEVLSDSMEKMKERLASYRKNTLQSTMDKKEMEKELNLAKDIEMGMVPTKFPLFPDRNDFDCYGRLIPAKIVGGDLFDIFLLDENQLFISISDTLGKGIPAAMFSVMTRTFIRSIANPITRMGKMMEALNDGLSLGRESDMFATVLMGKLNLLTGEFIYCNAGHPHPIILRNNQQEDVVEQSHGIPVGVRTKQKFSESSIFLATGESLIFYTDGVTEEYNEEGDFFGTERLNSVIKPLHELSTQNIVNKTLDILEQFRGGSDVHDDTTMVALKYTRK